MHGAKYRPVRELIPAVVAGSGDQWPLACTVARQEVVAPPVAPTGAMLAPAAM